MTKALISIIVPVFNVEKYLSQCINSILNQTYSEIELILIDDGSTDKSAEICDYYKELDKRVQVIHQANNGVSKARNNGIINSRGEFIMFVDSDDWIELNSCEILLNCALKNQADIIMGGYIREFKNKSLKKYIYNENRIFENKECISLHRRQFGLLNGELKNPENLDVLAPCCMKLYRTSIIKDNNILFDDIKDIGTFEDGLFNIKLFKFVEKAVFLNFSFYHYRKVNEISITTKYKEELKIQWNTLYQILYKHIEENELNDEFKIALNNRIALNVLGLGLNICNSNNNIIWKLMQINEILNDEHIKNCYKTFSFMYLPLHWRLFYGFIKYRSVIGTYMMLCLIKNMKGRV